MLTACWTPPGTSLCWFCVGCSGHRYTCLAGNSSRAALNRTIRSTRPTISGQSARTVTPCSTCAGQRPHVRREHVQPGNSEREARAATATIPMIDAYQFGPRSRNKSPGRSRPSSSPNGKWLDVRPPARHPAVLRTGRARAGTLGAVTIVGLDLNRTLLAVWTAGRRLTRPRRGPVRDRRPVRAPCYLLAVTRGWPAASGDVGCWR